MGWPFKAGIRFAPTSSPSTVSRNSSVPSWRLPKEGFVMDELLNIAAPTAQQRERELVRTRGAVSTLLLVNGMLLATWVSRIPAIEEVRGLGHASFGVALLIVALGAVISMPLAGTLSSRWGTNRVCKA